MGGAIHPLPLYAFMAWFSVKTRGQLYLLLYLIYFARVLPIFFKIRQKGRGFGAAGKLLTSVPRLLSSNSHRVFVY
jgi:hypothetical protein